MLRNFDTDAGADNMPTGLWPRTVLNNWRCIFPYWNFFLSCVLIVCEILITNYNGAVCNACSFYQNHHPMWWIENEIFRSNKSKMDFDHLLYYLFPANILEVIIATNFPRPHDGIIVVTNVGDSFIALKFETSCRWPIWDIVDRCLPLPSAIEIMILSPIFKNCHQHNFVNNIIVAYNRLPIRRKDQPPVR